MKKNSFNLCIEPKIRQKFAQNFARHVMNDMDTSLTLLDETASDRFGLIYSSCFNFFIIVF